MTSLPQLGASFRFRPRLRAGPCIFFHVYAFAFDDDTFRLEQPPLKTCVRLSNQQASACANHTMPRDTPTARAGGHSVSSNSCASAQAKRLRERSVGCYAATRNFFHQVVNRIPRRHCPLPLFFVADFPEEPLFKARLSEFRSRLLSQQIKHLRVCEVMSGRLLSSKSFSGRAARSLFVPLTPFRGMLQD
jgi:hypothetical protein